MANRWSDRVFTEFDRRGGYGVINHPCQTVHLREPESAGEQWLRGRAILDAFGPLKPPNLWMRIGECVVCFIR